MDSQQKFEVYVDRETKEFQNTLNSRDDLVLIVLRVHLSIEQLFDRIVLSKLKRGDKLLDKGNMTFYQKIQLVDSFDIIDDGTMQAVKQLNKLRNTCSHEKAVKITAKEIDDIGKSLGSEFTKIQRELRDIIELYIKGVFILIYHNVFSQVALLEFHDVLNEKGEFTK
jgi:hypothetical protein